MWWCGSLPSILDVFYHFKPLGRSVDCCMADWMPISATTFIIIAPLGFRINKLLRYFTFLLSQLNLFFGGSFGLAGNSVPLCKLYIPVIVHRSLDSRYCFQLLYVFLQKTLFTNFLYVGWSRGPFPLLCVFVQKWSFWKLLAVGSCISMSYI